MSHNLTIASFFNNSIKQSDSEKEALYIFKHSTFSRYSISTTYDAYIPHILSKERLIFETNDINVPITKIKKDVLEFQFDQKLSNLEIEIKASDCILPLYMNSTTKLLFERNENNKHYFYFSGTTSNFEELTKSMLSFSYNKKINLPIQNESGEPYKFLYIICPFYHSEAMKISLSIKSTSKKINKRAGLTFQENPESWTSFINEAFFDSTVQKKSLRDLINPDELTQYILNFGEHSKYLVYIMDSNYGFEIQSTQKINFIYVTSADYKDYTLVSKIESDVLDVDVPFKQDSDKSASEPVAHYFYFEKSNENIINLIISGNSGKATFKTILQDNWKYFLFILLFIFLIILWRIIKRIREKMKQKNKVHKKIKEEKKKQDIEVQRRSRRITKILNFKNDKLSGSSNNIKI